VGPELVSGELIAGAFALSEPEAGSDPAAMRTTATRTSGGWRLDGCKQWITSGDHAGVMVVWAVTDPTAGHKGITAFVVPGDAKDSPSRGSRTSSGSTARRPRKLVLDGVEVGADAVLASPGGGFALAMVALDGGGSASPRRRSGRRAVRSRPRSATRASARRWGRRSSSTRRSGGCSQTRRPGSTRRR